MTQNTSDELSAFLGKISEDWRSRVMNNRSRLAGWRLLANAIVLVALAAASACGARLAPLSTATPPAVSVSTATAQPSPPASPSALPAGKSPRPGELSALSDAAIKNATYVLPNVGAVTLKDGGYENKYGAGASQVNTVGFQAAAFGDLHNHGATDAAVILWVNSGGSGVFYYLAALLGAPDGPHQAALQALGDRVKITYLAVTKSDGAIVVNLVVHSPNDPLCCPSQQVTRTYRLDRDTFDTLKLVAEVKAQQE